MKNNKTNKKNAGKFIISKEELKNTLIKKDNKK